MVLLLLILLIAVVCGFVGALVKGLLRLLVIGIVLFLAGLVFGGVSLDVTR
ncbi:hypothetical protein [Saccharothrix sp. ST-888]|uniref:hypothetical protein n=1 Tax=Saccharothrix sp. ST-888 TaxID=1427391 RepID=UPI000A711B8E|nr:hypothetical protein [Saccharothrix sp. ST-888]